MGVRPVVQRVQLGLCILWLSSTLCWWYGYFIGTFYTWANITCLHFNIAFKTPFCCCFFSHVMESIFVLLSSPAACNHTGIFTAIRNLFHQLTSSLSGQLFLSYQSEDVINGIIRTLIQGPVSSAVSGLVQVSQCYLFVPFWKVIIRNG